MRLIVTSLFAFNFPVHLFSIISATPRSRIVKRESLDPKDVNFQPGSLPEPRIVGGVTAGPGEFPSVIRMGFVNCAGTIIGREWVLTAAHCAVNQDDDPTKNRMSAGKHNVQQKDESNEQKVHATHIYIHEDFNKTSLHNDIALLKVTPPFEFNKFVQAAIAPRLNYDPTGISTAVGWGGQRPQAQLDADDNTTKPYNPLLQKVDVPVLTNAKCRESYPLGIFDTTLCAGYDEGGKDACYGDSGGPLYHVGKNNETLLIGIVSWGKGCAQPKFPGVYTRVSKYSCWIKRLQKGLVGYTYANKRSWSKK